MGDRSNVRITKNEDGQYFFVVYNFAVLRHKTTTKLLMFVFSFDSNNKLNDLFLLERLLFLMTFLVRGQILYGTSRETL